MNQDTPKWPLVVAPRASSPSEIDSNVVLEIYKEYLKSVSDWDRLAAESEKFYSGLNIAMLTGFVFLLKERVVLPPLVLLAITVAATWFATMWILTNISYSKAVSVKMEVVQEIEEHLPIRPFKYEWEEKFKKVKYIRLSRIQRVFPVIFVALYLTVGASLLRT